MRSVYVKTLSLSVAMLCLLANLALAGRADDIPRIVRQGTVITVDAQGQATLQLEDGTTFTMPEKPWQHSWKAGDLVQCSTEDFARTQDTATTWSTTCERY
jgi:hypothetical protein